MLSVAVVGADGAGKSTVVARVVDQLRFPVRHMYLGVSSASATHPLPTTRVARWASQATGRGRQTGGPPPLRPRSQPRARRSAPATVRAAVRTSNRIAEEAYQEAISRWHRSCGRIVVYDRFYPADFHAHDLSGRSDLSWDRRLHAVFLRRCFAPPDLVVVLDADPEVLHARKGEGTLAELTSRRAEYLDYAATVPQAVRIAADQPLDDVVAQVLEAIGHAVDRASAPRATGPGAHPDADLDRMLR